MAYYSGDINKLLKYRTLCKRILKYGFPTKGSYILGSYFLRYSKYGRFEVLGLDHFGRFATKICEIQVRLWNKKL